jgi:GH18 family chitinase
MKVKYVALKITHKIFMLVSFMLLLNLFDVHGQAKVVGYVTNNTVSAIDYAKITHLNIAFENPDASGNLSYGSANNTYIKKAHDNGKKVLVSIAGGFASEDATYKARYFDLISDAKRAGFVQKIAAYIADHNFDGLDVDLEGSSINADYGKFITDLSAALKANGKLLTTALSHMNGGANVPDEALLLFDFVNIMAYDATGPWNKGNPGQHSTYDFAVSSLDYWVKRGLPKEKAILGVPFYGYGFGADFNEGMAYSQIINKYAGAENRDESGNTIYYNGRARAARHPRQPDGGHARGRRQHDHGPRPSRLPGRTPRHPGRSRPDPARRRVADGVRLRAPRERRPRLVRRARPHRPPRPHRRHIPRKRRLHRSGR